MRRLPRPARPPRPAGMGHPGACPAPRLVGPNDRQPVPARARCPVDPGLRARADLRNGSAGGQAGDSDPAPPSTPGDRIGPPMGRAVRPIHAAWWTHVDPRSHPPSQGSHTRRAPLPDPRSQRLPLSLLRSPGQRTGGRAPRRPRGAGRSRRDHERGQLCSRRARSATSVSLPGPCYRRAPGAAALHLAPDDARCPRKSLVTRSAGGRLPPAIPKHIAERPRAPRRPDQPSRADPIRQGEASSARHNHWASFASGRPSAGSVSLEARMRRRAWSSTRERPMPPAPYR